MNNNTEIYITPTSRLSERIEEIRTKEEGPVDKSFYTTSIVGLFKIYIPKPQSITSRSGLELLKCYRIFPTLRPTFYYTNCFVYALE